VQYLFLKQWVTIEELSRRNWHDKIAHQRTKCI
jgi:hypothetical protein